MFRVWTELEVLAMCLFTLTCSPAEGAAGVVCGSVKSDCFRGGGNDTLDRLPASDPASASPAACCTACTKRQPECKAWQIISKGGTQKPSCWLMATTFVKSNAGDQCQGAKMELPIPPERNSSVFSGVWVQHGDLSDLVSQGFVRGGDIALMWSDAEVGNGQWNFSAYDSLLADAVSQGFYVETALMVGEASPDWIYDAGVPKVRLKASQAGKSPYFDAPYYLSQTYQSLFLRALATFSDHLKSLPPAIRGKVVAVQAMYGSTGDDTPWHGVPTDPQYNISDDQWHNFTMSTAPTICHTYSSAGFRVLWNTNITRLERLVSECPGSYIKAGMVSHSFQVNYEADNYLGKGKICHTEGFHCRGESWPFMISGFWNEAPMWATYWHLMWQLTFGVDMPGLSEPSLLNTTFEPFYRLFNRYAASVRPPATSQTWPGAIVALRDGLDSSDTDRFPETQFGQAVQTNQKRLLAIAKAFEAYGAAEGDPQAAASGAMASRRRKSMNDVGWRIWPGNYGNGLITQLNPGASSVGHWRVGPKSQPYGRFARGFQHASGKLAMPFQLDKRLWGGLPRPAGSPTNGLTIHVTYFDGVGGFRVLYDAWGDTGKESSCEEAGPHIKCNGTQAWVTTSFVVGHNARFGQGCAGGADVVLNSTETEDAIIHGLQVVVE